DPAMSPFAFFQQVDRCGRRIAVALDLSASTQSFFQTLTGADASYATLLEEERQALSTRRELSPRDDLRHSLERAEQTIGQLRRLCEALEGKYLDYRINRSIAALPARPWRRALLRVGGNAGASAAGWRHPDVRVRADEPHGASRISRRAHGRSAGNLELASWGGVARRPQDQ